MSEKNHPIFCVKLRVTAYFYNSAIASEIPV